MSGYSTSEYADTLFNGGVQGSISITNIDGAIQVTVSGGANLPDRQLVTITPTNGDIFFGFDNTVTVTTGTPICEGQTLAISAGDCVDLYIVTGSASAVDVRITEAG